MNGPAFAIAMFTLNLVIGLGGARFFARWLRCQGVKIIAESKLLLIFIGGYFLECMAFPAGMASQVFVVGLAFVWGAVLGFRLPLLGQAGRSLRLPAWIGVYSSMPTLTFCIVLPVLCAAAGRDIFSAAAGVQFGMPEFVPLPFQTIAGFSLLLGFGTLILKVGITTGTAMWIGRRSRGRLAK